MGRVGLNNFDPNVLPMDAFTLGGTAASVERLIGLKAPWKFDSDSVNYPIGAFVSGRGWWIKFGDGTLVQRQAVSVARQTLVDANIGTYGWSYYSMAADGTWTFPIEFIDADVEVFGSNQQSGYVTLGVPTASAVSYNALGPNSQASIRVNLLAVGRWK